MMTGGARTGLAELFRAASIYVEEDSAECAVRSGDLEGPASEPVQVVLQPANAAEVQKIVETRLCEGVSLFPPG